MPVCRECHDIIHHGSLMQILDRDCGPDIVTRRFKTWEHVCRAKSITNWILRYHHALVRIGLWTFAPPKPKQDAPGAFVYLPARKRRRGRWRPYGEFLSYQGVDVPVPKPAQPWTEPPWVDPAPIKKAPLKFTTPRWMNEPKKPC